MACTNWVSRPCPQLETNYVTGGADCGPCATIQALELASCGRFNMNRPPSVLGITGSSDRERRAKLVTLVRQLGGMPTSGATSVADNWRAFNQTIRRPSMKDAFAEIGLQKPSADYYWSVSFDNTFLPQLVAGKSAHVFVDYYAIGQSAIAGQCVSSRNYRTDPVPGDNFKHFIMVRDYRLIGGVPYVTSVDSLYDGRYSGSCNNRQVPSKPQDMRVSMLRAAAGDLPTSLGGGTGKVSGYIFDSSAALTETPPEDTGPGTGLALASIVGATNFKLYSVGGIAAGDYLEIGPPFHERFIISTVGTAGSGGTGLTTSTGAVYAHDLASPVATGYVPPPTADIYDLEPFDPCGQRSQP